MPWMRIADWTEDATEKSCNAESEILELDDKHSLVQLGIRKSKDMTDVHATELPYGTAHSGTKTIRDYAASGLAATQLLLSQKT